MMKYRLILPMMLALSLSSCTDYFRIAVSEQNGKVRLKFFDTNMIGMRKAYSPCIREINGYAKKGDAIPKVVLTPKHGICIKVSEIQIVSGAKGFSLRGSPASLSEDSYFEAITDSYRLGYS